MSSYRKEVYKPLTRAYVLCQHALWQGDRFTLRDIIGSSVLPATGRMRGGSRCCLPPGMGLWVVRRPRGTSRCTWTAYAPSCRRTKRSLRRARRSRASGQPAERPVEQHNKRPGSIPYETGQTRVYEAQQIGPYEREKTTGHEPPADLALVSTNVVFIHYRGILPSGRHSQLPTCALCCKEASRRLQCRRRTPLSPVHTKACRSSSAGGPWGSCRTAYGLSRWEIGGCCSSCSSCSSKRPACGSHIKSE
jgi:hypothetical protein